MARGDPAISGIYRLGEATPPAEHLMRRRERERNLFRILWLKHGLMCLRAEDLPENDPLAQHIVNIVNQRYGRRANG